MNSLIYFDEIGEFTQEDWDAMIAYMDKQPKPGDALCVGDDEDGNPIYVVVEDDILP